MMCVGRYKPSAGPSTGRPKTKNRSSSELPAVIGLGRCFPGRKRQTGSGAGTELGLSPLGGIVLLLIAGVVSKYAD